MRRLIDHARRDPVLVAALLLAVGSMFWVAPSADYVSYIDFRVLGILLGLMLVMAGFQKNGFFELLGSWLLGRCKSITALCVVLIFVCFFLSMFITNDVALITFVPFAILTLSRAKRQDLLLPVIISQTLAANLGSMLTPLGNPQNLYLYDRAGYSLWGFVRVLLPYTLVSGLLLLVAVFVFTGCSRRGTMDGGHMERENVYPGFWKNRVYLVLFLLCLFCVFRMIPYYVVVLVIVFVLLWIDPSIFVTVDYSLLLTFVFFFVFTGNLGRIPAVEHFLAQVIAGREVWIGILTSQFISNVPATLLLSGFTSDYRSLLIGVDLGGLGTLIASMASLISYKLYAVTDGARKGKYILWFTVANLGCLVVLAGLHLLLS